MKNLNDLTIKEYNDYATLLDEGKADGNVDIFSIMEIFGIKNPDKLNYNDFQEKWDKIKSMSLSLDRPKTIYNINGRLFKPQLKVLNLTAGQFIDLQNYLKNYKLHQVLSVFMMPTKKNIFGKEKSLKYGDYDVIEVQDYLYNNMKIGEANELAAFFLQISITLLKIMNNFSEMKLWRMIKKKQKSKKMQIMM